MNTNEYSEKVKKDADKLIAESGILEILSKYGKVEVTGSYAADLMWDGDIDIHVFVDKLDKDQAQRALNDFISGGYFLGYMFFDWVRFKSSVFPCGYYLGLKHKLFDYKKQWKVDVWFVEGDREQSIEYSRLLREAGEVQRNAILEFKKHRDSAGGDYSSAYIYDAVLKEGIIEIDNFKRYMGAIR